MKTLFRPTSLVLFFIVGLFLGGCEHHAEIAHDLEPQIRRGPCAGLEVSDLDLSEGFRGFTEAPTGSNGPDFQIFQHGPSYPFSQGVSSGDDCQGICTFRVTFRPLNNVTFQGSGPSLESINLNYDYGGNTFTHHNVAYTWSYPILDINEVYYNADNNYSITFQNGHGQSLAIASTEVLGGLCVIENIDKTHIPGILYIQSPMGPR